MKAYATTAYATAMAPHDTQQQIVETMASTARKQKRNINLIWLPYISIDRMHRPQVSWRLLAALSHQWHVHMQVAGETHTRPHA